MAKIYLIGSLRNPEVPKAAMVLRQSGHNVFDDWYSAGEFADDSLYAYESARGHDFIGALKGHAAQHIFAFDKRHLDAADMGVLLMPAGRSCHLELGYILGQGKRGYVVFDKPPERIDVMYNFATACFWSIQDLIYALNF